MNRRKDTLHLVSNADEKFFPGLYVAVLSALACATGKMDYQFWILDGGLSTESWRKLHDGVERVSNQLGIKASVVPLQVDETELMVLPPRRGSRMTYAKLVLPQMLNELDSVIYLDGDVLCFKGLEEIVELTEGRNELLAGSLDYFAVIQKDCPWLDQVPKEEWNLPYINCGVMWMNLKGLREIGFTRKAIEARAAIGEARQGDQSVFNYLCRGQSLIISDAFNHRTAIGSSEELVNGNLDLNLHYIGAPKPWLGDAKSSNWLAHQLWHQANSWLTCFEYRPISKASLPKDRNTIFWKSILYKITNPRRHRHYQNDLLSLKDPADILKQADSFWSSKLGA